MYFVCVLYFLLLFDYPVPNKVNFTYRHKKVYHKAYCSQIMKYCKLGITHFGYRILNSQRMTNVEVTTSLFNCGLLAGL